MNRFIKTFAAGALLVATITLLPTMARADTLTYQWSGNAGVYSGGTVITPGSGGSAWLTAQFQDVGTNEVLLTLTANFAADNNLGAEVVSFNVSPESLLKDMQAQLIQNVYAYAPGANSTNEGPVKTFDLELDTGAGAHNLQDNMVAKVKFTLKAGSLLTLNANSFNAFTTKDGITYYAAAHIQDTRDANGHLDSSWVASGNPGSTVPLPAAAWAGFALLGGLGVKRRIVRRTGTASA